MIDAVRSTIEPYLKGQPPDTFLWAWFKVCVNREGDVVDEGQVLDLPLAKMVIHKHGGLIRLRRQGSHQLLMNISLPIS